MTEGELARLWCSHVQELAALLAAAEGARAPSEGAEGPPEVLSRIQALVQGKLLFLYTRCARLPSRPSQPYLAMYETMLVSCVFKSCHA